MVTAHDNVPYLSDDEYFSLVETLGFVSTIVMFELARSGATAHVITRNFLARGKKTLEAIKLLWQTQAYADCWSLHRTLLDRLFHLHTLANDKSFDDFDKWSFVQQYEARNTVLSDQDIASKLVLQFWKASYEQKQRYQQIKVSGVRWERPKAENAAKSLGYPFLYKYGYDFASAHVHPMANDGEDEFKRATGLGNQPDLEYRVILHNSVLAQMLLVQESLLASGVKWNPLVQEFLDATRAALLGNATDYKEAYLKIRSTGPDGPWSDLP